MSGDDHPRAFVLDECQEYEPCISNMPWCNVLVILLGEESQEFEAYAVWTITLLNTKNIPIRFDCQNSVHIIDYNNLFLLYI